MENIEQKVRTRASSRQNKAKEAKDRRRDLLAADKGFHTYIAVVIKCVKVPDDSYQSICLCSQSKTVQADPQKM